MLYNNPVIKGYNPDPSMCRVSEDYYLVTSTFEFFPGVPVYHSKNLVDWTLINYCLTDEVQLPLKESPMSAGIYAPTIRHHNGRFYMTTTNCTIGGNFIVYTDDIYGKWSNPIYIKQGGIDPSLLFEDDKVYYCSAAGEGILLSEINIETGEFIKEPEVISNGDGGKHPEAPHIYKINGYYYLMLAEGGTEYGHMVTMFRAKDIYGPYDRCERNPILSHKDFYSPIQATGHADMLCDQNGNWWMCFLGIRPIPAGQFHNLGRETFLAPVIWSDDGFPVVGNNGTADLQMDAPLPAKNELLPISKDNFYDDFTDSKLNLHYNFYRNPEIERFSLIEKPGKLVIKGGDAPLSDDKRSPAFMGIRQKDFNVTAEAKLSLISNDEKNEKAGITAFYNWSYHYDLFITKEDNKNYVCLRKRVHDIETVTDRHEIGSLSDIELKIEAGDEKYSFLYKKGENWTKLGTALTVGLCKEQTFRTTFTGTYIGMFTENAAGEFDYFRVDVE